MRVALYGGSFDPPHVGHVLVAAYLTSVAGFDRVLVVPVFEHAFDKRLAPFEQRLRLCELAFARLRDVEVSPIERDLGPPSYTIVTVETLLEKHPDWELAIVIGTDVLHELERWHRYDELQAKARFFVLDRRGVKLEDAHPELFPEISSSQIREWFKERGGAEHEDELQRTVPQPVLEAIRQWQLYQST